MPGDEVGEINLTVLGPYEDFGGLPAGECAPPDASTRRPAPHACSRRGGGASPGPAMPAPAAAASGPRAGCPPGGGFRQSAGATGRARG